MGHFAKLDTDNKVIGVHVLNNEVFTIDGQESEQAGIDFLTQLHNYPLWKQTSYNGSFRFNYAAPGYTFDPVADAFYSPSPNCHPELILDTDTYRWKCANDEHKPKEL